MVRDLVNEVSQSGLTHERALLPDSSFGFLLMQDLMVTKLGVLVGFWRRTGGERTDNDEKECNDCMLPI